MIRLIVVAYISVLLCPLFASGQTELEVVSEDRVIAVGGMVTEVIYALGEESLLIAVDDSSLYPPQALEDLPSVGFVRELSAENILALNPSLVITTQDAGPPETIEQLQSIGLDIRFIETEDTLDSTIAAIRSIAEILGSEADDLVADLNKSISETRALINKGNKVSPTVAFIYARGAGTMLVSGTNTSADSMIQLAGARNAVSQYSGYKPLTDEALIRIDPDLLLFTSSGLRSLGGINNLSTIPALSELSALKEGEIIHMDDLLLLGFGPRLGNAIYELAEKIYR